MNRSTSVTASSGFPTAPTCTAQRRHSSRTIHSEPSTSLQCSSTPSVCIQFPHLHTSIASLLQDVEKGTQLRSRLANILNVPQKVRLRRLSRLRPCLATFLNVLLSDFPRIENIQHDIGRAAGDKQHAVHDHRKRAERTVSFPAIGPDALDTHFKQKHKRHDHEQGNPDDQLAHSEPIERHEIGRASCRETGWK